MIILWLHLHVNLGENHRTLCFFTFVTDAATLVSFSLCSFSFLNEGVSLDWANNVQNTVIQINKLYKYICLPVQHYFSDLNQQIQSSKIIFFISSLRSAYCTSGSLQLSIHFLSVAPFTDDSRAHPQLRPVTRNHAEDNTAI